MNKSEIDVREKECEIDIEEFAGDTYVKAIYKVDASEAQDLADKLKLLLNVKVGE